MNRTSKNLLEKIESIKNSNNVYEVGRVISITGVVLTVSGIEDAFYMEEVEISNKAIGYVEAINRDNIKVSLVKIDAPIRINDPVVCTRREIKAQFSRDTLGHVVNIFGDDLITGSKLPRLFEFSLETENIPIMDRTSVNRPLSTGIMGIDLMYPIGKGQRQLIIGDKKTGKTQICLDTIVNQKGKDVVCIYVALGKTKKDVKSLYEQLVKHGAASYSIIVAAFNDDPSPLLKNTPYATLSLAEELMKEGKDVLVCIDDLKRHADCCREIALLQGHTPGRDAYPPDIFYCHSRMLEKGCQHMNGGSITILPICETRGGDITDYISTNIISITDGQIVLSKKNFDKGQKPAIDYGLSVSRLGGAVQTAKMKRVGSQVRIELLNYLEQREVYELANVDEMAPELKSRMLKGRKVLDSLVQYKYAVKTEEEMLNIIQGINAE